MGFQIKDKDGNAIAINALDAEAAAFWGVPVDTKWYASPENRANWFDHIGYQIHSPDVRGFGDGWKQVKMGLVMLHFGFNLAEYFDKLDMDNLKACIESNVNYEKPFIDLINHWESKGYTPHRTND